MSDIISNAPAVDTAPSPSPQQPRRRLRWWQWALIALGALIVISVIGSALGGGGSDDAEASRTSTPAAVQEATEAVAAEPDTTVAVPEVVGMTVAEARAQLEAGGFTLKVGVGTGEDWLVMTQGPVGGQKAEPGSEVSVIAEAPEPVYSLAQQNAISKARSYLALTGFSRTGLIGQLEFEGFSTEDATFGADNAGADWNAEAAEKAKSYLDMASFSRDGLYDQLAFEGFTDPEIQFGLTAVGY